MALVPAADKSFTRVENVVHAGIQGFRLTYGVVRQISCNTQHWGACDQSTILQCARRGYVQGALEVAVIMKLPQFQGVW
jgi:hypothetical protein